MAPLTSVLKRTVVQLKALNEQPRADYVLLLSGAGAIPDVVVTIDSWTVDAQSVVGFRADNPRRSFPVIAFPLASSWVVLHRAAFVEITREDSIRRYAKDAKDLDALHRELDGEADARLKKAHRVEELQLERALQELEPHGPGCNSKAAPAGHYL